MAKIIVVTSGKGGVGKTTTSASFASGLALRGHKTAVIDFDVGLRNLDLIMGCERRVVYDLINVIHGEANLNQALIKDKRCENLFILPASQTRDKDALSMEGVGEVIDALRQSIEAYWIQNGRPDFAKGAKLVMSFHGLPKRNLMQGDPYHCECLKTGRLLGEALGLKPNDYRVTFQSRFGRAEWLKPYTALMLEDLGKDTCPHIDIVCPGFPADCLETLEEIAMEGQEIFHEHGGGDYRYIPCLNDDPVFISALEEIAKEHMQGWPTIPDSEAELALRERRANEVSAKIATGKQAP